jgi:hypothetical protein
MLRSWLGNNLFDPNILYAPYQIDYQIQRCCVT